MNRRCSVCEGKGVIQRDGRATKTKVPYDVICGSCNGAGILKNVE